MAIRAAAKGVVTRWGRIALGFAALGFAALGCAALGCAARAQLIDERTSEPYAALVIADEGLQERTLQLSVPSPEGGAWPVRIREVESPAPLASERPVLVLLNGVFSDGGTWRFVTAPLADRFDLLVIDLPGTGGSAGSAPDELPPSAFTLPWLGERVWGALAIWQARQPAPRPLILVGHSLAGAVVLRMLGDPQLRAGSAELRALTVGAVLIGAADVGTAGWSPVMVELTKLSDVEVEIGGALGILESEVRGGVARSVEQPEHRAFEMEAARMLHALEEPDLRRSSQLMLRRIRPIDEDEQPIWSRIRPLVDDHARVDVPVLLLWGENDDILPIGTAQQLRSQIPGSRLVIIEGARHSVHQEKPLRVAAEIARFVDPLTR